MTPLRQTWQVTLRYLRVLARQPAFLFIALVQPIIWLLLFGALFKAVTEIPGFAGGSYIDFLTPGVVVMLAVSSAGWTGMGFIEDIDSGVMDRMLASPVWRGALNLGSVLQAVIQILIQTLLIVLLALALGAHYENGVGGVLVLMLVASLLGGVRVALERPRRGHPPARVADRRRDDGAAPADLPLLGADAAEPRPDWIGTVARFNPVNWAVEAGRSAAFEPIDWGLVAGRVALLGGVGVVAASLATRAFRAYQRSLCRRLRISRRPPGLRWRRGSLSAVRAVYAERVESPTWRRSATACEVETDAQAVLDDVAVQAARRENVGCGS